MSKTSVTNNLFNPPATKFERLIDEHQAAALLGLSVKTLRRWRWLKRGVPWIRVGAAVRYAPEDINAFIEVNRQIVSAGRAT